MTGKSTFSAIFLMVVAAAALIEGTVATVYFVGDNTGWTIPTGGATFYSNWAANHTFAVGDILVFNFVAGAHDVARVTKTAFDSCSSTSPISLQSAPPVNITLSTSEEYYFICTFGQHCASGQKLSVNVPAAAGSPTPTPSPSPASPTSSPTPSPSSPTPSTTPTPAPTPSPTASPPSPTASPPSPSSTTSPPAPPPTPPSSSPPPSESTSPPPSESTSPPPPPPSSAPKAVAAFGMVVMSIAIGALF